MVKSTRYDVVIIGGGLVGTALAAALSDAGLRIALVDARLPTSDDHRLFALSASSCQLLQNLGLWQSLSDKAAAIHQVHASRQGHFGAVRLKKEEARVNALGHVIPAFEVEKALNNRVATLPEQCCTIYRPAKLITITQQDTYVTLGIETASNKISFEASLVVGADGTESTVRKELNFMTEDHDFQQTAIVFKTTLQRSHQHIAYERFTDDGAIAMLPLPDNQCASICTIDNAKINEWLSLDDHVFLNKLQKEFGYRLGKLNAVSQRYTYPLRSRYVSEPVSGRVILIGNAAHTMHPVASQGFNLALYEVATLVDVLVASKNNIGAVDLKEVQQKFSKQLDVSTRVSSKLPWLFSIKNAWLSLAIQLGMIGLDTLPPLKQSFIKGMMGRKGSVPSLLLKAKEL